MFEAPIPGQSLTTEPKNSPWENPSELSDVGDVINYYIEKLMKEDTMDDIVALLDLDVPVVSLVEGLYMKSAMNGIHTIDAGVLAAPAIHAFIVAAAEQQGVDVKEEGGNAERRATDREKERFIALTMKYMAEEGVDQDAGTELLSDITEGLSDDMPDEEEEAMPIEAVTEIEEPMSEEKANMPTGLMSKGI
jgi:hypothetical protein